MKKVLFLLLCVCTCMATMATISLDKKVKLHDVCGEKLLKTYKFSNNVAPTASSNPLHKKFMDGAKKSLQDKKVSHENLVNKRDPRRFSDEEIVDMPYVCYLYAYTYDENGNYIEYSSFNDGGGANWYPDTSNGLYFSGLYWDEEGRPTYYLPLDIDYQTGEIALSWGLLLRDDTTSSSINTSARNRTDTIRWSAIMSEAYFLDDKENDCMGTLYEDGSIIFDDNYVYYCNQIINHYVNNRLSATDTTEFVKVYIGTEILTANGMLTFAKTQNGTTNSCYVRMFQNETNDTLFVGNLWDMGMPNVVLTIDCDAKMHYNCIGEAADGTTYKYNPIWDVDDSWINGGLGMFYGVSGYTKVLIGLNDVQWGVEGEVTPDKITWDYSALCNGYHTYNDSYNNELIWIDGNQFHIPEQHTPDPDHYFTIGEASILHGDTAVIPVSLTNAEEVTAFQADLYLPEGFKLVKVPDRGDSTYLVTGSDRLSENHELYTNDQNDGTVRILCYSTTLQPIAGHDGELFYITVATPDDQWGDFELALVNCRVTTTSLVELKCSNAVGKLTVLPYLKGDANGDRQVTVTDVVVILQYILGLNPEPFNFEAADMNDNGEITVTDAVLVANSVLHP